MQAHRPDLFPTAKEDLASQTEALDEKMRNSIDWVLRACDFVMMLSSTLEPTVDQWHDFCLKDIGLLADVQDSATLNRVLQALQQSFRKLENLKKRLDATRKQCELFKAEVGPSPWPSQNF